MWRASSSILSVAVLCAGCAVGPDYTEPALSLPPGFVETGGVVEPQSDDPAWWRCFGDEMLGELIDKAVKDNHSVREALARVSESRALRREAFLNLFPGATLGADYTRFRNSSRGQFSAFGGGSSEEQFASLGLDAAWEIDIFGGLRRERERRSAQQAEAEFVLADVLRIVIADTAKNYVELRSAQARLDVAEGNARLQRSTSDITATMAREGASSEFEAERSRAQLTTTEAEIPLLDAETKVAVNALSVLTVQGIAELRARLLKPGPLRFCDVPRQIGVPSELLRRRPDLRAAERRLAAATADIGVSVSEFFPRFTLSGRFSYEAKNFSKLDRGDEGYFFGPGASWSILNFGRIRQRVRQADARAEQALQAYEGIVLNAIREAEDGLVRFNAGQEQVRRLRDAVKSSRHATELARARYQQGDIDLLEILDVQRVQLVSELALAGAERMLALASVDLYKALGGGWEYATLAPPKRWRSPAK